MIWTDLGGLVLLNLAGAASPGPDIVLITRTAVRSRKHALATTLGIQVGVLMWCTLTVVGAAALLNAFPTILEFVQIIGGGWITWMGISMLRSGWAERDNPPVDTDEAEARLGSTRSSFWKGLITNLSNPKIVLFLAALVAPLLPPSPSVSTAVIVILALWLTSMALQVGIVLVVSTNAVREKMLRAGPYIDMGAGLFFLVAGVSLIVRGIVGLL
ncbi:LysE family translocator [Corynebacterium breve]|uniref:LysE family translocator n=1 Tax=Corynebacterium breve TaxID=3049799 RepID=A0ABY8VBT8_9CORY|nr:LysE family translocator [Corynebacterium breve]WIM67140.1 LysE family translocator [Corynebacterium breve]